MAAEREDTERTPSETEADHAQDEPTGSTPPIERFIVGTPYPKIKTIGRLAGPAEWTADVIRQTADLPHVSTACELEAEFVLPANKFTKGNPYGVDIDNLLKRLLDALSKTIFLEAPKNDAAIVSLKAWKRPARGIEDTGVRITVRPTGFPSTCGVGTK